MKKIKLLLVFSVLAISVGVLGSCGDDKDGKPEEPKVYFEGNTHDLTATDTDKYMLINGATDYAIVISADASDTIKTARDEFIYFFKKATGVDLPWKIDKDLTHNDSQKYISIGENNLFNTSGLTLDKLALGLDGITIRTVGNTVYLCGGSDSGSLYSVYDFMQICFHYEQYSHKILEIDEGVRDLKLKNFAVTDIPDIPMRCHSYGFMDKGATDYDQKMFGTRMKEDRIRNDHRMPIHREYNVKSFSKKSTNSDTVISYDLYFKDHPKWFSDACQQGQYQWCYTAHGDPDEYNAFIDEVAKKLEFSMTVYTPKAYPSTNCLLVMMEDNFNTCGCDECKRQAALYGAESGAVVKFMNKVTEKVLAWQELPENAEYKRDDLKICFNAYNAFEQSPTHYDEAIGDYVPNHADVVMNDHLGVYFAIINNLDNQQSLFANINKDGKAMIDGWTALTKWLELWVYETDFSCACYFYDSFEFSSQQFFNYIAGRGVKMLFSQGIDTNGHAGWTGICWNQLKAYLNAKLTWNSRLDETELINNWFTKMYKEAAPQMRKVFNEMRSYYKYLLEAYPNLVCLRSIYNNFTKNSEFYPLSTLQSFVNQIDAAKVYVEKYKVDPELYKNIVNEIEAQAIFPLYVMLTMHNTELTAETRAALVDRLTQSISDLALDTCVIRESGSTILATVRGYAED